MSKDNDPEGPNSADQRESASYGRQLTGDRMKLFVD
jgi:hypothetical protein